MVHENGYDERESCLPASECVDYRFYEFALFEVSIAFRTLLRLRFLNFLMFVLLKW